MNNPDNKENISRESQIDILQQHGASNRKHGVIERGKIYKRFASK